MTISELFPFVMSILRVIFAEDHVRNSLLSTTVVVLVYAFFTNHLSVRRLGLYAGLFLILCIGEEIPRMDYRTHIQGITDPYLLWFPVIFSLVFFGCVWLGFGLGFTLNRILYLTFNDPWGKVADHLDRLAASLRQRSTDDQTDEPRSWDELRKRIEDSSHHAKAKNS